MSVLGTEKPASFERLRYLFTRLLFLGC